MGDAASAGHARRSRPSSSRRPACCGRSSRKGLFPPDDTGSLNATAEAAQGTSFDGDAAVHASLHRHAARDGHERRSRTRRTSAASAGRRTRRSSTSRSSRRAQRPPADDDGARADAADVGNYGAAGLRHEPAGDPHRRPRLEDTRISTRCAVRTSRSCTPRRTSCWRGCRTMPTAQRRDVGSAQPQPDPARPHRPQKRAASLGVIADRRSRTRWPTRTTSSRSRRSSRRRTSTGS